MRITNLMTTALVFAVVMTVSCKKDDPATEPYDPMDGRGYIYPHDDVEQFVHKVLKLDEYGNIIGTQGGLLLDESDPGKVTIVAEDFDEAESYFEGLFPTGADTYWNSNGDLIWNLKDTLDVHQGYAVLRPVSGGTMDGRIAEIEVPTCARPLSSIVFIPKKSIPLNDSYWDITTCDALDYYYLGATVRVKKGELPGGSSMTADAFQRGQGDFVVIREYEPGKHTGYLVRLEPGEQNHFTESSDDTNRHRRRSSYTWTLETVHNILKANTSLLSNFTAMGCPSWDNYFMCRKNNSDPDDYRYQLKDGKIETLGWFNWYYYEAFIYLFTISKGTDNEFYVNLEWE